MLKVKATKMGKSNLEPYRTALKGCRPGTAISFLK